MLSASLIQLEYVPKQWKSTFSYSFTAGPPGPEIRPQAWHCQRSATRPVRSMNSLTPVNDRYALIGLVCLHRMLNYSVLPSRGTLMSLPNATRPHILHATLPPISTTTVERVPVGGRPRDAAGHAQVSRQAKHYAHRGINALMSCDKAFQNPCHSAKREQKYVQQHIRICTHGVKTGLG